MKKHLTVLVFGIACLIGACVPTKDTVASSPINIEPEQSSPLVSIRSEYQIRIDALNKGLGIGHYELEGLTLEPEALKQKAVGNGQTLNYNAADSFMRMQQHAKKDKVRLVAISGYRSPEKQAGIIRRKLEAGQTLEKILKVNRPPGYSQHSAGVAIDVSAGEANPLSVQFAKTTTYRWLVKNAHLYGFVFPYPPGNTTGITFEPWHLQYVGD